MGSRCDATFKLSGREAAEEKVVLVTGGNSGIGFELCNQLLEKGDYHVILGSRSVEKGEAALKELVSRDLPGSIDFVQLDVTDDDSIKAAVKHIEDTQGQLDILVNNAGIHMADAPLREQMRQAYEVNAIGPAVLTKAVEHLLRESYTPPRIVNVSTGGASIGMKLDPNGPGYHIQVMPYRASKAALSMVSACQVYDYREDRIKVFSYSPGFTVSNLGPHNTAENGARSAAEACKGLVDIIEGKRDAEAGGNLHDQGDYPW